MDIQSAATAFAAAATLFGIIIMIGTFFPARCVSEAIIDKREQRVRGLGGSVGRRYGDRAFERNRDV